jgi:MYXO-CTERM domain-containing protein
VACFLRSISFASNRRQEKKEKGENMKKVALFGSAVAFALLLAVAGTAGSGLYSTPVAFAQDGTAVPTAIAQAAPVQTTQPAREDNNDFPWGLLGLVGLAGLAGLRRQPEPVRREAGDVKPTVGMYETRK